MVLFGVRISLMAALFKKTHLCPIHVHPPPLHPCTPAGRDRPFARRFGTRRGLSQYPLRLAPSSDRRAVKEEEKGEEEVKFATGLVPSALSRPSVPLGGSVFCGLPAAAPLAWPTWTPPPGRPQDTSHSLLLLGQLQRAQVWLPAYRKRSPLGKRAMAPPLTPPPAFHFRGAQLER